MNHSQSSAEGTVLAVLMSLLLGCSGQSQGPAIPEPVPSEGDDDVGAAGRQKGGNLMKSIKAYGWDQGESLVFGRTGAKSPILEDQRDRWEKTALKPAFDVPTAGLRVFAVSSQMINNLPDGDLKELIAVLSKKTFLFGAEVTGSRVRTRVNRNLEVHAALALALNLCMTPREKAGSNRLRCPRCGGNFVGDTADRHFLAEHMNASVKVFVALSEELRRQYIGTVFGMYNEPKRMGAILGSIVDSYFMIRGNQGLDIDQSILLVEGLAQNLGRYCDNNPDRVDGPMSLILAGIGVYFQAEISPELEGTVSGILTGGLLRFVRNANAGSHKLAALFRKLGKAAHLFERAGHGYGAALYLICETIAGVADRGDVLQKWEEALMKSKATLIDQWQGRWPGGDVAEALTWMSKVLLANGIQW